MQERVAPAFQLSALSLFERERYQTGAGCERVVALQSV
jgi:hypothetical protein